VSYKGSGGDHTAPPYPSTVREKWLDPHPAVILDDDALTVIPPWFDANMQPVVAMILA
jgi:hypothetical protein